MLIVCLVLHRPLCLMFHAAPHFPSSHCRNYLRLVRAFFPHRFGVKLCGKIACGHFGVRSSRRSSFLVVPRTGCFEGMGHVSRVCTCHVVVVVTRGADMCYSRTCFNVYCIVCAPINSPYFLNIRSWSLQRPGSANVPNVYRLES